MSVSRTAIASRFSSSKISAGKFREQLSLRVFLLPKISAGKFREQLSLRVFLLPNVPPANFANRYRFAFFFFSTFRRQISRTAIASRFSSFQRSVGKFREQLSLRVFLLSNVPSANFANSYRFAFFFFPTFRRQISRTAIASRFSSSQRSASKFREQLSLRVFLLPNVPSAD